MFRIDGMYGRFPAFSLTGSTCRLNCRHCRGRLLKGMRVATTPSVLKEKLLAVHRDGLPGVLISGGADPRGRLPWEEFLPVIREVSRQTSLILCAHTGIASPEVIHAMETAGIDQVLFDVIPDPETFETVFGLDDGFSRLCTMIKTLRLTTLRVSPHFILGFHGADIQREIRALDLIEGLQPAVIVIIQFMPLPGTPMAGAATAPASAIAEFTGHVRNRFPEAEIALGCARHRPDSELEIQAVRAGIHRLALPHADTLKAARTMGYTLQHSPVCCAVDTERPGRKPGGINAES